MAAKDSAFSLYAAREPQTRGPTCMVSASTPVSTGPSTGPLISKLIDNAATQPDPTSAPEARMIELLDLLVSFPNRGLAIAAALKAARLLQQGSQENMSGWFQTGRAMGKISVLPVREHLEDADLGCSLSWGTPCTPDAEAGGSQCSSGAAAENWPENCKLATGIDEYPKCKRLIEGYRRVFQLPNKTPLSILFEYATRSNLQLTFVEGQTSQGLYIVTVQSKDKHDAHLYRPGIGQTAALHIQAKSKKEAKQLAAAALLENILNHVPVQELLYTANKQQGFQAHGSPHHPNTETMGNRSWQRKCTGVLSYRSYMNVPQWHAMAGSWPLPIDHRYPLSQGLPGASGGLPDSSQDMDVPGSGLIRQAGPRDMRYGQVQPRMLLACTGSDPDPGLAHMPGDAIAGSHGLASSVQEHHMHKGLLCNDMGLSGMGQQPGQGKLSHIHAGLDPSSCLVRTADLGLQGFLIDSLQGSLWQDCIVQESLAVTIRQAEGTVASMGRPSQPYIPFQDMALMSSGDFNLPWLPDNSMC